MTIKVGTIQEITGDGYELLVDSETRSFVLAKFFNGKMVETADDGLYASSCLNSNTSAADDRTALAAS